MRKIKTLSIENFKAFATKETFELKGRHLLVFGTNGSGKSSIFWSIHTFLQCGMRHPINQIEKIEKYFDRGTESLHNLYTPENAHSEIEIVFEDDTTNYVGNVLGKDNYNSIHKAVVKDANKGADFINHRLLMNFYNYRNSEDIDLWPVFKYQIFPFVFEGDESLADHYMRIEEMGTVERPKTVKDDLAEFNSQLGDLIGFVNGRVNTFLKDHFWGGEERFKIELVYTSMAEYQAHSNKEKRQISSGIIGIKVQAKKVEGTGFYDVPKPQSFLNEAVLNAMALSIRLMVGKRKSKALQTRILALDDLLISLDMANRMKIIRILLKEYADDHQILLFTHDRGFYKLVLNEIQTQRENWVVEEFYARKPGQNPERKSGKDDLQKAEDEISYRNFDAAANYLRKYVESFLIEITETELEAIWKSKRWRYIKDYLGILKKQIQQGRLKRFKRILSKDVSITNIEKLSENIDKTSLSREDKGTLKGLKSDILGFAKDVYKQDSENADLYKKINELERITDRILNPGSHGTEAPFFQEEMDAAVETIKQFRDLLIERKNE